MNHHIFLYHIQCIALHNLYLYLMRTECALFCHPCASVSRPVQQKIGSHLRPRGSVFPRPFPRADGVTTSTVRLLFTPLRGLEVKLGVTVKKTDPNCISSNYSSRTTGEYGVAVVFPLRVVQVGDVSCVNNC